MKKNYSSLFSMLVIVVFIFGVFYFMMPQNYDTTEASLTNFSTKRALKIIKDISQEPHFVGSQNHEVVANYLQKELQNLGLQTSIQEGFTLCDGGVLVKSKNIVAKIKGTTSSKALLLLSHYDSAPHSFSKGASDDATGIATILEGIRAFLHSKINHKNDIIILFTDAEELGLNGATLFVTQHKLVKEIGLAINFEARGTSGPSYMLMETNKGNAKMVEAFSNANVKYPVSNSLMYSIYKMLPNDTDLTIFRENGKIQGFNFAFIDSHYNYHTVQDNYQNLDPNTLAHQGTYLMPLLNYFSKANLSNLNSSDDKVYFSIPFKFVSYSFSWIIPMLLIAFGLFGLFVFIGLARRTLQMSEIGKGFLNLFGSLIVAGLITYGGWKLLLMVYPQYNDILHGFTYNGHDYIYAFVSLTMAICFLFYKKEDKRNPEMSQLIAPLFIWLLLNSAIAIYLKGAGFFIIPVLASIIMLGYYVITQKSSKVFNNILALPSLIILVPLIQMFPVGLGLKILFVSALLTVLCFGLLLPVFGSFTHKKNWATVFFLLSMGLFIKAHLSSEYTTNKAKPNSLLYVLNGDTNKAHWVTYDKNLDQWTKKYLGNNPQNASKLNKNKLYSKYGSQYTFMNTAPLMNIARPNIEFVKDSTSGSNRYLKIIISPNRNVNRYDVFSNGTGTVANLKANGVKSIAARSKISGKISNKILSYYVIDNLPLEMEFSIPVNQKLDLNLVESSFDLMTNPIFKMQKREDWMMPTPFVLNNAVVIEQKIKSSLNPPVLVNQKKIL
jgi:Peptidase family M28